ncbi:shikimate dehydrogenase [Williamsia serinedens]|uniref:Shikimate dehydrogenase (NADP(+)) n=1 Tax=Williamsia serinedens TaxID=391736 RepID=A0ABT1H1U7_9NOCA|nr:shikimate dehydrogenase [Williamsia serinedens]MCP2160645.1 shikimate dehydrogenase [Williamsia serinedens]
MFSTELATAQALAAGGTQVCALVGQGISQSLTPALHEREGAAHGIAYRYLTLDVAMDRVTDLDLGALLDGARAAGIRGLNVTHPFKQAVIAHLDDLSPDAARLGAVNTVLFDEDGARGHNTDWSGFARNLDRGFGSDVAMDSVVQVGAGGAGAATAYALVTRGVSTLHLVDVDRGRAEALADAVRAMANGPVTVTADDLRGAAGRVAAADGLVNATPLGMADHPGMAVDRSWLRRDLWVADIVYRPVVTELVRTARQLGARTLTGDGMAAFQAVDAFGLFCGVDADAARMLAHVGELVAAEDAPALRSA